MWRQKLMVTFTATDGVMIFSEDEIVVLRVADDQGARQSLERLVVGNGSLPWPIEALASGRKRLELTRADAEAAVAWARGQAGWDDAHAPVFIYDPVAAGRPEARRPRKPKEDELWRTCSQ
jgi:hypothetical protein